MALKTCRVIPEELWFIVLWVGKGTIGGSGEAGRGTLSLGALPNLLSLAQARYSLLLGLLSILTNFLNSVHGHLRVG